MKVILLQKVAGLGNADDVKEVADGHARNFLFPRHLAVQASPKVLSELQARHKRVAKEAEHDLHEQQELAQKLDGSEIRLTEKANEKGMLYAGVSEAKVSEALLGRGFTVEKNKIIMKPIKEVGAFPVKIKFRHGLEAEITVSVQAKGK